MEPWHNWRVRDDELTQEELSLRQDWRKRRPNRRVTDEEMTREEVLLRREWRKQWRKRWRESHGKSEELTREQRLLRTATPVREKRESGHIDRQTVDRGSLRGAFTRSFGGDSHLFNLAVENSFVGSQDEVETWLADHPESAKPLDPQDPDLIDAAMKRFDDLFISLSIDRGDPQAKEKLITRLVAMFVPAFKVNYPNVKPLYKITSEDRNGIFYYLFREYMEIKKIVTELNGKSRFIWPLAKQAEYYAYDDWRFKEIDRQFVIDNHKSKPTSFETMQTYRARDLPQSVWEGTLPNTLPSPDLTKFVSSSILQRTLYEAIGEYLSEFSTYTR